MNALSPWDEIDRRYDALRANPALERLNRAAIRIDAAKARFDALVNGTGDLDEIEFGDAEREYLSARASYRSALFYATGQDPDDVWRRLS